MEENKREAFKIIILFGIISLLGDMIYEGARSVNGPYLKTLGASAAIVGLIAGIGEFLGYAARLLSGFLTDKTKAYWLITIIGYGFLLSVPLMGLVDGWQLAAMFILLERFGKAIRSPSKQTILSQAAKQVGTGFGFALHEAMDQLGAVLGPLVYSLVFFAAGTAIVGVSEYKSGYLFSFIPSALLILVLLYSYFRFRNTWTFGESGKTKQNDKLSKSFWIYNLFTFLTTFGFINFLIIGYHLKASNITDDVWIPIAYSIAMGVDAIAALIVGKLYDRLKTKSGNEKSGLNILIVIPLFTLAIPVLVMSNEIILIACGIVVWGIVMGTHETIMKAAIADITSLPKRGSGYGIFNTSYGLAVLFGSSLAGLLYDYSIEMMIIIFSAVQLLALISYFYLRKSISE
jgi:MFS family permease